MSATTQRDEGDADDDQESFAGFLGRLYPQLVAVLSLYTSSVAAAEDIAQDALAAAWRQREQVEVLGDPTRWVFKVAINRSRGLRRRALTELRYRARVAQAEQSWPESTEDRLVVRAAVRALPGRQREVIALRYFGDLSVEDTAVVMGCALGTVKALTHQAIATLQARIGVVDHER